MGWTLLRFALGDEDYGYWLPLAYTAEGREGDPIRLYAAYNERDEADFVIGRLKAGPRHQGNL